MIDFSHRQFCTIVLIISYIFYLPTILHSFLTTTATISTKLKRSQRCEVLFTLMWIWSFNFEIITERLTRSWLLCDLLLCKSFTTVVTPKFSFRPLNDCESRDDKGMIINSFLRFYLQDFCASYNPFLSCYPVCVSSWNSCFLLSSDLKLSIVLVFRILAFCTFRNRVTTIYLQINLKSGTVTYSLINCPHFENYYKIYRFLKVMYALIKICLICFNFFSFLDMNLKFFIKW